MMKNTALVTASLRLLETTDLHMQLLPFDYLESGAAEPAGLVALAPLIAAARADGVATILCDNGDFLQGTPLADEIAIRRTFPHPMIVAFNALEFDAVTPGNHEFEYGLAYLRDVLADCRAAVVSANLRSGHTRMLFDPWTIIKRAVVCSDGEVRTLNVGVIGFAPPQITEWNGEILQGAVLSDDIVSAARTHLPQIRRAGADLVVALCHGGPVSGHARHRMENAALPLAALPGIDVVMMGHLHGLFPGPGFDGIAGVDAVNGSLHGKPAVMAGARGQALGQVDLSLGLTEQGNWQIVSHRSCIRTADSKATARSASETSLARTLRSALAAPHAATLRRLREMIGQNPYRLTTYFAALGHDDPALLLARIQIEIVREALMGSVYEGLPVLASTSPFCAGDHGGPANYVDIAPGAFRVRDCMAIIPFDNTVCAVLRRGWEIRQWLAASSKFFATLVPGGQDQPLLDPQIAPYHFDTLHGLSYRFDLSVPPYDPVSGDPNIGRVCDLKLDGAVLDDDALCIVATNSYRARGGGGMIVAEPSDVLHVTRTGLRQLLTSALRAGSAVPEPVAPSWGFVPLDGATALFSSSPKGQCVLDRVADTTLASPFNGGFAQFRLTL